MNEWEDGISKWRADKVKSAFKKKHGRSLGSSRKSSHISRRHKMSARHSRSKKQRLHRVSPKMQREWAEGISQWVIQREVARSNHYFLKKFGIIKGNSSEEWKEGIQVWLDQGLLNKSWKWRASKGKFKPSKNRRRIKRLKSVISGENRFRLKSHTPNKRKQTSTASTESEANSEELQIYIFKNKAQFGPYPLDEIEKFLVNSQLNLDDLAFHKGCENWIKVSELPNLKFKQEPKKPEKLIPKKEHQVVQKPTLRKPDEKSQRNRSEKVNVSHESNHSQIQIEPRKTKRKFLILGSASLILMGLVAAVFYYLNQGHNQNIDVADRNYTEKLNVDKLVHSKSNILKKYVHLNGHPALGMWKYFNGHTREISESGHVTLRLGKNVIWVRRCISKSENGFVLEGNKIHELRGDTLLIEGQYKAVKEYEHKASDIEDEKNIPLDGISNMQPQAELLRIIINIDGSGSLQTTKKTLEDLRTSKLKSILMPYYNNDDSTYDECVQITTLFGERTLQFFSHAAQFKNVLAIAFQFAAHPIYHKPNFNRKPKEEYLDDLKVLCEFLDGHNGFYRGIMLQTDRGGKIFAKGYKEFVQNAWQGKGYLSNDKTKSQQINLSKYYITNNEDLISSSSGVVFSDGYHIGSTQSQDYFLNLILNKSRELGLDLNILSNGDFDFNRSIKTKVKETKPKQPTFNPFALPPPPKN